MTRRDALLVAVLPSLAGWDLGAFAARFDAAAPLHLRWGLRLAALLLVAVAPRLCGHLADLRGLSPGARDAVLHRVAAWPIFADLLELAKLAAAFARFDGEPA